jgi:hypothetical protein
MDSTKQQGRICGWLYFLSSVPAPFSLLYVPGRYLVSGDPAATAGAIRAGEAMFRLGIVAELLSATLFLLMGLAFYRLFDKVSKGHAKALLWFVGLSVPITYLNELARVAALMFAQGTQFAGAMDPRQLDALSLASFQLHQFGVDLAQIFWGLWLFPLAVLVWRCGWMPRVLAVLLALAGAGYVAASVTAIAAPSIHHVTFMVAGALGGLGELPTMLWLIIVGAKPRES